MKVLLIHSGIDFIGGPYYVTLYCENALKHLGIEVIEIGNPIGRDKVQIDEDIDRAPEIAASENPDWILHIHGLAHEGMKGGRILEKLKKSKIPIVLWVQNDEIDYDETVKISPLYDLFCCYTRITEKYHRSKGANFMYLPLAADHTTYFPTILSPSEQIEYSHDLVVIGWKHAERSRLIEELSKYYKIFCNWNMSLPCEVVNKIYNASKIMLSIFQDCDNPGSIFNPKSSILHDKAWGLPCRTFEVPASKAFQLQEDRVHLKDCYDYREREVALVPLKNGKTNIDYWKDKIDYYLENVEERKSIAELGYKRTIKEHLYIHRMKSIVDKLEIDLQH